MTSTRLPEPRLNGVLCRAALPSRVRMTVGEEKRTAVSPSRCGSLQAAFAVDADSSFAMPSDQHVGLDGTFSWPGNSSSISRRPRVRERRASAASSNVPKIGMTKLGRGRAGPLKLLHVGLRREIDSCACVIRLSCGTVSGRCGTRTRRSQAEVPFSQPGPRIWAVQVHDLVCCRRAR